MEELVERAFSMLQLSNVKPEQMKVVKGIVECDVFIVLPKGYRKSACFQSLSLVYDQLLSESDLCFITADPSHARHNTLSGESICILAVAATYVRSQLILAYTITMTQ